MDMNRSMARSTIYNILSLCYTYPDEKVFGWIMKGEWTERLKESLELLSEQIAKESAAPFENLLSGEKEERALEMAREYTRLFISAFPHVVAPPYGSIYLEKDGLVYGESTSKVLRFYHETGFTLKEDLKDLPDHIAHEMQFMGILADAEGQASDSERMRWRKTQMDFFSGFILPWVPIFCEKIMENSRSPFYRFLGDLTREFIDFEKNYLGFPEESPVTEGGKWQNDMQW
jgi:TorA maturation chaperone TorD